MKTPQIKIIGRTGSGKSSIAQAIKTSLAAHNINCEISGCEDERLGVMEATWKERLATLAGKSVSIKTIQEQGNARLFDAAPDLLASLIEALDANCGEHESYCAGIFALVPCDCWISRAEATIKKVT